MMESDSEKVFTQETPLEHSPLGTAIFGVFLFALGLAILYFTKDIRSFALGESDPGPKALPLFCGSLLLTGGFGQLISSIFREELFTTRVRSVEIFNLTFLATLGLMVAYVALLNTLGYLLATALFMMGLLKLFRSSWIEAVNSTVVLVCFVYVLFEVVFKVSLPRGLF